MKMPQGWTLIALALVVMSLSPLPALAQYVSFFPTASDSPGSYPSGSAGASYAAYGSTPTYITGPESFGPGYAGVPANYMTAVGATVPGGSIREAALFAASYGEDGYEWDGELCEECRSLGHEGRGRAHGPFDDCNCGPRWFNVSAEAVYLTREQVSRRQDFAMLGQGPSNPIVLSTNDLDFDHEPGFRATGRIAVGTASNIEASFLGGFEWNTNAQVTDGSDNLYSVLSAFGTNPNGGFVDTDQASFARIDYSTQLNSGEVSWRHHWASPGIRLQGSWLLGARFTNLEETLVYITVANAHNDPLNGGAARGPGDMNYRVETRNNLIGFQTGGDAYFCVVPGLVIGGDVKAGIYGNRATQDTIVNSTTLASTVLEEAGRTEVALVAEGGVSVVYQISPSFSLRAGYQAVFLDGVALAPENLNENSPFGAPRTATINTNGSAFYHGATGGFEWMW